MNSIYYNIILICKKNCNYNNYYTITINIFQKLIIIIIIIIRVIYAIIVNNIFAMIVSCSVIIINYNEIRKIKMNIRGCMHT